MVVENDEDMRDLLVTALSHAGYEALGASSAEQALSFLDDVIPTVVVIDFLLGDMNGVELADAIRRRPSCRRTPCVLLTAAPDVAKQEVVRSGLNMRVLAKPVALDVLARNVDDLLVMAADQSTLRTTDERLLHNAPFVPRS